jgi:hypothetical protein
MAAVSMGSDRDGINVKFLLWLVVIGLVVWAGYTLITQLWIHALLRQRKQLRSILVRLL